MHWNIGADIQTFPSPVLTRTSTAYTSWTSNSHFSWSFLETQQYVSKRLCALIHNTITQSLTMCRSLKTETSSVVIEIDQGLCCASKLHWKTVQSHGADAAVKYKPRIESNTRAKKRKCSLKQSLDYGEMPLFLRATNEYLEKRSLLGKEIWRKKCGQTAGYKYSWRKMEAAAQDRAGWRQVVCGLCSTGSDKE